MEEKLVDITDRAGLILSGILSFAVGLMFSIAGLYFVKRITLQLLQKNEWPDGIIIFVAVLTVTIALILLSLSYKFFTGKVGKQHISTPLLVLVSACFITFSVCAYNGTQTGYRVNKAIGGSMAAGCLGLYFAYRRMRIAFNERSDNRSSSRSGRTK